MLYVGRCLRGSNGACSALCSFSVTAPPHNQIGPFWCWFPGWWALYILGPCGSLQRTLLWGWEFLQLQSQPPQVFSISGLRFYFSRLELWVMRSVAGSASCCLATCLLCQVAYLCPCYRSGWMCLLYLLGCWTSIQFNFLSVMIGFCFFKLLSFFWLCRGGTVCLPMPPSWLEVSEENFNQWSKMITLFLWKNTLVIIQRKENRKDKILPSRREKSIDIAQISKKWQIGYMSLSFQSTLCHFYRQYYQFICMSPLLKCKFSCSRQGVISPYRMS